MALGDDCFCVCVKGPGRLNEKSHCWAPKVWLGYVRMVDVTVMYWRLTGQGEWVVSDTRVVVSGTKVTC